MSALAALRASGSRKDALARAMLNLRSIGGGSSYHRFIVVGTARTGSTLLTSLLNAHSQALAFGELFRSADAIGWDMAPFLDCQGPRLLALYQADPIAFLDRKVFRRWPRSYAAVGFKLFYFHARSEAHAALWDHLAANTDILVLHIKRQNLLAQYYSLQLAHKTQVWSIPRPVAEKPAPIRLEAEACREHFARLRGLEQECAALFARHAVRDVYYETLVAEQDREMDAVQDFLGLRREKLTPRIARQRTALLREAIANFDELRDAFAETEWAAFFSPRPAKRHA